MSKALVFIMGAGGACLQAQAVCLDDARLEQALEQSKTQPLLLYLWSPRMVYSVQQAGDVAALARQVGLNWLPVRDAKTDPMEAEAALMAASESFPTASQALASSMTLCSARMEALDAGLHYPSAWVLHRGDIQGHALRGAMPLDFWRQSLALRLQADSPGQAPHSGQVAALSAPIAAPAQKGQTARSTDEASRCIPANEWVPLPASLAGTATDAWGKVQVALGSYERVSPDGRFLLRSYSGARLGQVSLVEFSTPPTRVVAIYRTPLTNEAFPVQGSWRYLVDINGDHYPIADILQLQTHARPRFRAGMAGFYAAAAEVPSAGPWVQIRSLSWPHVATPESEHQGVGALSVRTITVNPQTHILVDEGRSNFLCRDRAGVDGTLYALPMIAPEGQEFMALPQSPSSGLSRMKIFGFGPQGNACQERGALDHAAGKVVAGFATSPHGPDLVYEYRTQIWWYWRAQKQAFNIAPATDDTSAVRKVMALGFPGLTQDGRIVYAATWQTCSNNACVDQVGYVFSDPRQSHAYRNWKATQGWAGEDCITQTQVQTVRERFAPRWEGHAHSGHGP